MFLLNLYTLLSKAESSMVLGGTSEDLGSELTNMDSLISTADLEVVFEKAG
jgi:hypothetical protein